jgi:DNA topoisomerase-1
MAQLALKLNSEVFKFFLFMVHPSALPSGLIYIKANSPGYSRKQKDDKFQFFDQSDKRISDSKELDRIAALVIPPAWKEVWISPKSNTYLQATGIDEKDRKQYRYHENWSSYSTKLKYKQLRSFGQFLPNLRERYKRDLEQADWPKQKVLALAVAVMDELYIRVGNSQYTEANSTYGLTTLRRKHLEINGNELELNYIGKSGVSQNLKLTKKRLVRLLKACSQLPGYEIFRYKENDSWSTLDSSDINEYLNQNAEDDHYFTAKYFRTWGANGLCVKFREKALAEVSGTRRKPETELIRMVANLMGHTISICKNHYLDPEVVNYCLTNDCDSLVISEELRSQDYKVEERELLTILEKVSK